MGKEQVILGVNGYSKRTHDASACMVIDGELVAMAEEERFTRRKNAFGQVPYNAIAYCLNETGMTVDDVDSLATGWDFNKIFENMSQSPPSQNELVDLYLPHNKFKYSKRPNLEMVPHHIAHAASAYYLSGQKESLILVLDGQGETQSTSVYTADNNGLTLIHELPATDSLGYFYEAVSEYAGLSRLDAGKMMGLASYGDPRYEFDLFELSNDGYSVKMPKPIQKNMDVQEEVTGYWKEFLEKTFGPGNKGEMAWDANIVRFRRTPNFQERDKNFAASAQQTLENIVMHMVRIYAGNNKQINLCIAGGVGLNCSMNGKIAREGIVNDLFVPPFSNDAGVSVGAALYISDLKPSSRLESASLGPDFSNEVIISTLKARGIDYRLSDDIAHDVAKLLDEGKIIDWFQGRMEAGPRALGNRSILGDPTRRNTHDKLNSIKNRENWRPLAPSILAERVHEFMEHPSSSPFMLRAFLVKPDMTGKIPAAVHTDGTSRAQTVTQQDNPQYYRLISEFEQLRGVPVVMNTSFNREDEPIVCSPDDALKTFYSTDSDCLAIGNALVAKK